MNPNSYPSIYNLGHAAISDLLLGPVYVQEKVDGSQFSFMLGQDGEVHCRSKGCQLNIIAPEKMFAEAIEVVKALKDKLTPGYIYRGEYFKKPKHNTLAYNRIPNQHIILFDINNGPEGYLPYTEVDKEAARLGFEVVPLLFEGHVTDLQLFRALLDNESVLGGQKIEGVVIKPVGYDQYGKDKKCLMGKYVSEAFKEVHQGEWRKQNPSSNDILQSLAQDYKTPARWNKAISHLKERGLIEQSPTDIGLLLKEVQEDVAKECEAEIKDKLWAWAWPKLSRMITAGLPQWYKDELVKLQFEGVGSTNEPS
jgi:hypothetical protein